MQQDQSSRSWVHQDWPIPLESPHQAQKLEEQPLTKQLIKKQIYSRTLNFFLKQAKKAKQKNREYLTQSSTLQAEQQKKSEIHKIIRSGLKVQQYLGQDTDFYRFYLQQVEVNFDHLKNQRKKIGFRKAKQILQIFLKKNQEAQYYFLHSVNWVKQRIPSYPHKIEQPIYIRQIQRKIKKNQYQKFEDFMIDVRKLWSNNLLYSFQNEQMSEMTKKFRTNMFTILCEVLQLKNYAQASFINPSQEYEAEMMDIDEQIGRLRKKVAINQNKAQYLDYDPDYFQDEQCEASSSNTQMVQNSKNNQKRQKASSHKINSQANNMFKSCQASQEKIKKYRIMILKQKLVRIIQQQMAQLQLEKRTFLKYINMRKRQNPQLIGTNNEINLEKLGYEQFIELQNKVDQHLNSLERGSDIKCE